MDPGQSNPKQNAETIQQFGQTQIPGSESNIYCMTIIGQIEGHLVLPPQNKTTKYEHLIPQLVAAEQNSKIEGVLVILNTVGGDVEAGLAIAEMIATLSKPTVTLVLGGGHSIGVPIAVSANYTIITETATMTIHPIRLNGLVIGVPQSFEYLDKMQERVTGFVLQHSNISERKFKELMFKTGELARDIGTTVIGSDAVKYGLMDAIGGLGDALKELNRRIEQRKRKKRGDAMMHHSIVPDHIVYDGIDRLQAPEEVTVGGVLLQVERLEAGKARIVRLISPDPFRYADPQLSPGQIVDLASLQA